MRRLPLFLLLLCALLPAVNACGMGKKPEKAEKAKDFTLPTLDGGEFRLADRLGKVVLINFWATWCPPCRKEMPSIEKLHQKFGGQDFEVVAINLDNDFERTAKPFVREKGLTFTVLHDAKWGVADLYHADFLPLTYIIGRDGMVMKVKIGEADWFSEEWQYYIRELIERKD